MKKLVIGAIVGGILLFLWQTISWTALNFHGKEYQKAPAQDSIIAFLNNQFSSDGQYMLPAVDENATAEEREKAMETMQGKPWAVISYHKAYDTNMTSNIIRGLLSDIIIAWMICWILMKISNASFGTIFTSCILIGLAGYLFIPYSGYIWFKNPGATTNLVDALVSWGLFGLWAGWWLPRK